MARLRNFRRFRALVEELVVDLREEPRREEMRKVFYGCAAREEVTPPPPEELWDAGSANLADFLRDFCRRYLDTNLYNAAKHGLAIQPGRSAMQLDDGELIAVSGPSIDYLEQRLRDDDDAERWEWVRATSWLDLDQSLLLIAIACQMIEAIWSVARGRYLGQMPDHLVLFSRPSYNSVSQPPDPTKPIEIDKMQVGLIYYRRAPAAS